MSLQWFQLNQQLVEDALRGGRRPDLVATMASGRLDELVALHDELGVFDALDNLPNSRQRNGIDDALLLRTTAVLPFLRESALSSAAQALFGDPAILLLLCWSPVQISIGDNERHREAADRHENSLPCNVETLRDALRRVELQAWQQVQEAGVQALFERRLVRGEVYAIDGTGLGPNLRLVCLVCVSAQRPTLVAWRLLSGTDSEKGKEAGVTRLIEQALRQAVSAASARCWSTPCMPTARSWRGASMCRRSRCWFRFPAIAICIATCITRRAVEVSTVQLCPHHPRAPAPPHARRRRPRRNDQLGKLRQNRRKIRGLRALPVGLPAPADRSPQRRRPAVDAGQHGRVAHGRSGVSCVSAALAHRKRRLPRTEGRLAPGRTTLGSRPAGAVGPRDARLPSALSAMD